MLIPHWESRKTVGFFLRLRDRESEVPAHVETVAKITGVEIDSLLGRFPRHLSGGEKQRVSIARAFARDLELLLFDEPFANLDAKFRGQARIELKRLIQQFKVTLIYVTHDQVEAMSIADRIVVIRAGRVIQAGSYHALREDPDNLFVAEFLGTPTINAFWGRVSDGAWDGSYMGRAALPSHQPKWRQRSSWAYGPSISTSATATAASQPSWSAPRPIMPRSSPCSRSGCANGAGAFKCRWGQLTSPATA